MPCPAPRWTSLLPLTHEVAVAPACPHCKAPIRGVLRYGRPVNSAAIDLVERKHQGSTRARLAGVQDKAKVGAGSCRLVLLSGHLMLLSGHLVLLGGHLRPMA